MEFEVISTQCIKPSSPTPKHLKTHKVSLLDQFVPSSYIPIGFFYSAHLNAQAIIDNDNTEQRFKQLKESLSEVLTHFYPFAGRVKDKLSIDCNDEGVYYTEIKASCTLVEFLNQSNFLSFIHKFLPGQSSSKGETEGYIAMIQVTSFACGGTVIGVLVSHTIADGPAMSFFLNSWGSTSRREFQHALPNFVAPFPQNDAIPKDANITTLGGQFLNKSKCVMRRFLFDAEVISKLKAQVSSLGVQSPTRVEVVSSLISKCATSAFKANSGLERPTLVTYPVNMRRRASPTFPESCMGNFSWVTAALMSTNELPNFVMKWREALTTINSDFVKSLEGEGGFVKYCEGFKEVKAKIDSSIALPRGVNYINYISWCNFGLYNVDFGWGKPTWVSGPQISGVDPVTINTVLLMDIPSRGGIEAWVYLNEDDMAILQQDKKLLIFATLDPNPLQLNDHTSNA